MKRNVSGNMGVLIWVGSDRGGTFLRKKKKQVPDFFISLRKQSTHIKYINYDSSKYLDSVNRDEKTLLQFQYLLWNLLFTILRSCVISTVFQSAAMNSILTIKNNESHFIIQFLTKRDFKKFYFQTKITVPPQKKILFSKFPRYSRSSLFKEKRQLICVCVCVCVCVCEVWEGLAWS